LKSPIRHSLKESAASPEVLAKITIEQAKAVATLLESSFADLVSRGLVVKVDTQSFNPEYRLKAKHFSIKFFRNEDGFVYLLERIP